MTAATAAHRGRDERPVSGAVLGAAIEWQLSLDSGDATESDHQALHAWLRADAEHERAWQQLGEIDGQLAAVRSPSVRTAVLSGPGRRAPRRTAVVLGAAFTVLLSVAVIDRFQPVAQLLADHRTGTGERRVLSLPDGSTLHLDTRSAVDIDFSAQHRVVHLRAGQIAIETAHGREGATPPPFVVLSGGARLQALGTRFTVQRLDPGAAGGDGPVTLLSVQQHAVAVRPAACEAAPAQGCAAARRVEAGQSVRVHAGRIDGTLPAPPDADAWRDGMLVMQNQPLREVVATLARYRAGHLGVDPAVADWRVTGTLPLADTDQALLALTAAVPVDVQSLTRWWTVVRPRESAAHAPR